MRSFTILVTRQQLEAARTKILNTEGIHLIGDSGTAIGHGVALDFSYVDGDPGTLTFTVTHKPFYVSQGAIEDAVRGWFKT